MLVAYWSLAALGCAADVTGPDDGVIEVAVIVAGPSSDPDGFTVTLDQTSRQGLPQAGMIRFAFVSQGPHRIALSGIAPSCSVLDGEARDVIVSQDTVLVQFDLFCEEAVGLLEVTTSTGGIDLDPDGYVLLVDGEEFLPLGDQGIYLVTTVTGPHTVSLDGLSANCHLEDAEPVRVLVSEGRPSQAGFEVSCGEVPRLGRSHEIAFASDRGEGGTSRMAVYVMNDDGTRQRRIADTLSRAYAVPAWSADGSTLAFIGTTANLAPAIALISADGSDLRQLTMQHEIGFGSALSWAPDGSEILFSNPFELVVARIDGSGERLASSFFVGESEIFGARYSPDGTLIAFIEETFSTGLGESVSGVNLIDARADTAVPGPCFVRRTRDVAWAPDGHRLAITAASRVPSDGSEPNIFVVDLNGEVCDQITSGFGVNSAPAWSPDGRRIAFVSTRDGNSEIYVMNDDGSGQQRLTNNPAFDGEPAWRP